VHEWLPRGAAGALAALCGQVAAGGRICVGFANPRYPLSPGRAGALSLARAGRVLADAGMNLERTFVALPDHQCPALLVESSRGAELDYLLRSLFVTYLPSDGLLPGLRRRGLSLLGRVVRSVPHRLRIGFLPAYFVIARRPA
jgi:hypothetical protein